MMNIGGSRIALMMNIGGSRIAWMNIHDGVMNIVGSRATRSRPKFLPIKHVRHFFYKCSCCPAKMSFSAMFQDPVKPEIWGKSERVLLSPLNFGKSCTAWGANETRTFKLPAGEFTTLDSMFGVLNWQFTSSAAAFTTSAAQAFVQPTWLDIFSEVSLKMNGVTIDESTDVGQLAHLLMSMKPQDYAASVLESAYIFMPTDATTGAGQSPWTSYANPHTSSMTIPYITSRFMYRQNIFPVPLGACLTSDDLFQIPDNTFVTFKLREVTAEAPMLAQFGSTGINRSDVALQDFQLAFNKYTPSDTLYSDFMARRDSEPRYISFDHVNTYTPAAYAAVALDCTYTLETKPLSVWLTWLLASDRFRCSTGVRHVRGPLSVDAVRPSRIRVSLGGTSYPEIELDSATSSGGVYWYDLEQSWNSTLHTLGLAKCVRDANQGCMLTQERIRRCFIQGIPIASPGPDDELDDEFNSSPTTLTLRVAHRVATAANCHCMINTIHRRLYRLSGATNLVERIY